MKRGFRYQTGECKELAQVLKADKYATADIDLEEELSIFFEELEKQGIYRIKDLPEDTEALDREKEPEFFTRIGFAKQPASISEIKEEDRLYVDFFLIEEEEASYDDIFLG